MKKLWLFTAILIFLASVGWGQDTYVHVSGWTWEDKDNWVDENGDPVSYYPGENSNNDIVIIDGTTVSILSTSTITLGNLTINGTSAYLQIDGQLTVTELILDGTLHTATSDTLYVENIIVTANGEVSGGTIDMNGSIIEVPHYPGTLVINPVADDLGNINAGGRDVTITVPPNGNVNIGNISSAGNISISAGDGSNVHIGDVISSGGGVTINAGTGSTVIASDIDPTPVISGGGTVINIADPDTFEWIGASDTVWTNGANWEGGSSPANGNQSNKIFITVSGNNPVFSGVNLTCDTLVIQSGASLNMDTYNLTVETLENHGNLIIAGAASQNVSVTSPIANDTVTYSSSYTGFAGLTSFTNLVIQNGDRTGVGAITVGGDFTLAGGSLDAVSINVTGTSNIAGDVTTSGGTQTYSGAVTLDGTVGVTGTTVTLGAITGGGNSLTITGNGVLNGGSGIGALSVVSGNFTLNNNVLSSTTVNISGTSAINADITTSGTQTYTGAVTLGNNVNLTGDTGSTVEFTSSVNGTGAARSLTITNANVIFNGTVGTTLIGSVNVTAGTSTINADIDTTGNQTYGGNVTLTGTRTLASTNGSITASGVVSGTSVIVNASQEISLTGANVMTTSVELTSVLGNIEFNNNLGSAVSLTVDAEANNGNITITETTGTVSGTMDGRNITVNAGGNITLTNINGLAVELNAGYPDHEIPSTSGTVTLGTVTITGLTIWCEGVVSSSGTKSVTGNVDINTDNITTAAAFLVGFTISGTTSNNLRLNNNDCEFGPSQTHPTFNFIDSTVSGSWSAPINITGSRKIYITGTITAQANLTINTASGDIVFEGGYDAGSYNLNLKTTSGKIDQASGSVITVDNLTINSGGAVTLAQDNMVNDLAILLAGGAVDFKNNKDLEISGINAGTNTVKVTVNGDINLSGNITASSITIEAGSITGSGTATASTGDISLINSVAGNNNISLNRFNATSGTINVSTNTKDIVYYSTAQPTGGTWGGTPLFVEANSTYNRNVKLQTNGITNNIYLVNVVDSSQKTLTVNSSAGTGANGFIEFFATTPGANSYTYTGTTVNHLDLHPGAGGVRIRTSVVDITGNFNTNTARLTLDGSGESGIKAANINLSDITATDDTADKITLEAGGSGNITIGGNVTAYQLIAKAPNGTVSVNRITIDLSNTGYEQGAAAIYIVANTFVVTATGSIVPGGTGGQLCLDLKTKWLNPNNVVDGPEDDDPPGTVSGARWHQHFTVIVITGKILYSFTEDSDGNGRLDRIRVQTNMTLNGDFSGFDVSVVGYSVDRTKSGTTDGFVLLSLPNNDSFYFYLVEKPEIDGGNTPNWSVTRNTSLKDTGAIPALVGNPATDRNIKPVDTIPPRIAYTLTLPDHPQTYVRMSEPVASSGGDIAASFGGSPVVASPVANGYLFNHSNSYGIVTLAGFPNINVDTTTTVTSVNGYFQIDNIVDNGSEPSDIDPAYPPKYPSNWGYTAYGTNPSNVFIPPNKLLTVNMMKNLATVTPSSPSIVTRRVTDVLVSLVPTAGVDNYFVWPVWARPSGESGSIAQFDGNANIEKSAIETDGIELQARVNDILTVFPTLVWTTANIPVGYRNPQEAPGTRKAGGLWLPTITDPLYYYVPMSSGINSSPAVSSLYSPLFNYELTAADLAVIGAKFEFIFRLSSSSDMFAARLDAPAGTIPGNWYALVRPFVFNIQDMRGQRGGVTILNNVINSNNKEVTYIRYQLARPGRVTVQIYTLDGTLVKSLRRNEQREAGEWTDSWDGSNNGGRAVARGMYFVRVVGPDIDEIRKIMVIK
jgi:hypothetical protein